MSGASAREAESSGSASMVLTITSFRAFGDYNHATPRKASAAMNAPLALPFAQIGDRPTRVRFLRGGLPPHSRAPRIGLIYNPRSHKSRGLDMAAIERGGVFVAGAHSRAQLPAVLAEMRAARIDYLIVNGGDGTVRDVLTAGWQAFDPGGWPELAVLPKGKTNALNVDLGAPDGWTLEEAIDAYETGRRIVRAPLRIDAEGAEAPLIGFIFGAGVFATGIRAGQDAHRMGLFDSLAVGMTAFWGLSRAFAGGDGNIWRRGVEAEIRLGGARVPLPRTRYGRPDRRAFLLASTLDRLPAGLKALGPPSAGIRLSVMDHMRRRLMLAMPAILSGWHPRRLAREGFHFAATDRIEIALGDGFVLDGELFPSGKLTLTEGAPLTFVLP